MVEREMNSTAMSAKGRVRVSKHSAEELARLGRSDDGVDSGSEASGCSSGEEDDEVPVTGACRSLGLSDQGGCR